MKCEFYAGALFVIRLLMVPVRYLVYDSFVLNMDSWSIGCIAIKLKLKQHKSICHVLSKTKVEWTQSGQPFTCLPSALHLAIRLNLIDDYEQNEIPDSKQPRERHEIQLCFGCEINFVFIFSARDIDQKVRIILFEANRSGCVIVTLRKLTNLYITSD